MKKCIVLLSLAIVTNLRADGPKDNIPDNVRPIPPLGVEVPAEKKAKLETALAELKQLIDTLRAKDDKSRDLLPDVEIYYRAVHDALVYNEFLQAKEIEQGFTLLEVGKKRAIELADGKPSWTTQTGLVMRGFVSKIDNSVQVYGVWIPETYSFTGAMRYRLDIWFHGRAEAFTEGNFITSRSIKRDQIEVYNPRDTIVVYPYGRYCTAAKLAGEIDALEALADAQKRYRVDEERISARGFSMGGASAWHFAVHYSDRFFAANPGAGFSETPRFLEFFQDEKINPTPWEKKLLNMYDCDKWALNLANLPTIAYSGEIDKQKQAADVMAEALAKYNIDLVHIIAPKTAHQVIPGPAKEVESRMAALARDGRKRMLNDIAFETYTLKYNHMKWVTIDGMGEHWSRAEVRASVAGSSLINVKTENVTDLTLSMEAGDCPFALTDAVTIAIDGQKIKDGPRPKSDRSWNVSLHQEGKKWKLGARTDTSLRKRHELQGPIDDALMQPFIFVRPTGTPLNEMAGKWAQAELEHAIKEWRRQFRGYAIVKDDTAVSEEDIAAKNLILWGDPSSNAIIKKIAGKLPIQWDAKVLAIGNKAYEAGNHALILIYPNPLNPNHYVVVNSSFTYREYAYLNNARQVPMLPDWAVVDLRVPPNTIYPGKIVDADFFDEHWQVKK